MICHYYVTFCSSFLSTASFSVASVSVPRARTSSLASVASTLSLVPVPSLTSEKNTSLCHHIVPHHITSHHITSHHITSFYITSFCITSYHIISYHIASYHFISYHTISYDITSYNIISYHVISYHITSYHIISYHTISYHITSHHIISHHITSHHIMSRHITSHHVTSHHTVSDKGPLTALTAIRSAVRLRPTTRKALLFSSFISNAFSLSWSKISLNCTPDGMSPF